MGKPNRLRPFRVWLLDAVDSHSGTVMRGSYASRKSAAKAALALQRAHETVPVAHYVIGSADRPYNMLPGELVVLAGEAESL